MNVYKLYIYRYMSIYIYIYIYIYTYIGINGATFRAQDRTKTQIDLDRFGGQVEYLNIINHPMVMHYLISTYS